MGDSVLLFSLIDYSSVYFTNMEKLRVPARRAGKFVQIMNLAFDKEYFVMSPKELSFFHANIVERFCLLNQIAGQYNAKKDFFRIRDGEWAVIGGGVFEIDDEAKVITLSGTSLAYGHFCQDGLKDKLMSSVQLQGYAVIT
jgi:hypothetical protein